MSTMSTMAVIGSIFSILSSKYLCYMIKSMYEVITDILQFKAQRICVAVSIWIIITYGKVIPEDMRKWE